MRRTTSALTTTILGAVLAAPTVSAQQSPPARGASAPAPAAAEPDAGFGMAAARGARHLLRNGLDYIDYQEFDRALKYLREAEKRQAELNEPERVKLQQALERAQRGTREAIGSERPYALSQRSLRSGGFAPAESDTAVASKSKKGRAVAREGDDQAEPIRLAGAEAPAPPTGRSLSRVASAPSAPPEIPDGPAATFTAVSEAPAPAPTPASAPVLEPLDDLPTAPRVAPIEPVAAGPRPIPTTVADLAPAASPADAAQAQADLTTPFPTLEPPPGNDPAVSRSSKAVEPELAADPAPAAIQLELPDELTEEPAENPEKAPSPPAPRGVSPLAAPAAEPVPVEEPADAPTAPAPREAATLAPAEATPALELDAEPATPALDDPALDLPALPAELVESPVAADSLPELPADEPEAMPAPAPVVARPAALARPEVQATPDPAPAPVQAPAAVVEEPIAAPAAVEEPVESPAPRPTAAPTRLPEFAPAPAPAPAAASGSGFIPSRSAPVSTLTPDLERQVEELANAQENAYRDRIARQTTQPMEADPAEPARELGSDVRTQTQIDISRAPSPAEARPISAVPVPEDWVPLGARAWSPQRKYWAAAATCHLPLYFQDPMLERYGHSVENYMGPTGRFFAYPVDNHTQSTQRNQILQPFASAGQFAFQILTLPYAMIVDPPWEAQYDLGYWRPGDKIPTDMYYLPVHGTGPPLKGMKY